MQGDKNHQNQEVKMDSKEFFSIDYQCTVNVYEVDSLPSEPAFELEIPAPFRLASEIADLDSPAATYLRSIAERQADLAKYLKLQAQKTNVLLSYILSLQDATKEQFQTLSISAGGLSYFNNFAVSTGQLLRIKLFLTEQSLAIYAYGEVVSCEQFADGFKVQVAYKMLRPTEQELLIRATLQIQSQQLKARKSN